MRLNLESEIKKNMTEIKIGTQIWMSENLNIDCFSNGDSIPEAKTKDEWEAAGSNRQPAWCLYKNSQFLGKLYNWYAISDARGLAPNGWLLPTRNDWESLFEYIGGTKLAGKKLKNNSSSWEEFGGDDDFNFSVFPAGFRSCDFPVKDSEGYTPYGWWVHYWVNKPLDYVEDNYDEFYSILFDGCTDSASVHVSDKKNGMFVRCLKKL